MEENMKKAILLSVLLVAILGLSIVPAYAFVSPNGTSSPTVNSAYELYGPHVAGITITIYTTEQAEWTDMNILNGGSTGSAKLDLEDWALTQAWVNAWSVSPYTSALTLQNYGGEDGYYLIDLNNNATLPDGTPNSMADIYIRQAIAYLVNRTNIVSVIAPGALPMYTFCPSYMAGIVESTISPTSGTSNASLCYTAPGSSDSDPALAALTLSLDPMLKVSGGAWYDDYAHTGTWVPLPTMTFYVRADDPERTAIGNMIYTATQNIAFANGTTLPPLPITESIQVRAVCSNAVMGSKNFAMYTGAWTGIGPTPDVFFDLYAQEAYWNPGKPPDYDHISFDNTNGGTTPWGTVETPLEGYLTADYYALSVPVGTQEAKNAQFEFALLCCGVPIYCHSGDKAVSDTPATQPTAGYWQDFVNVPSVGMNNGFSQLSAVAPGSSSPSTLDLQYGFKSDLEPANILYFSWYWDSVVLGSIYDSGATYAPDLVTFAPQLFKSWSVGTWWDTTDGEYDAYVNLTLRPDLYWQDGVPVTTADVWYTLVECSKDLMAAGLPPPWWYTTVEYFLSTEIIDAYNMQILLDVPSVWALGWVIGSTIIPMHIWQSMISNYVPSDAGVQGKDPTMASADPNRIGSSAFRWSSYTTGVSISLVSNTAGSVVNGITSPGYWQYTPLRVDIAPDNNLEKIDVSPTATSATSHITISLYNLATTSSLNVTKYVYIATDTTMAAALADLKTATPNSTTVGIILPADALPNTEYNIVPSEVDPVITLTLPVPSATFIKVCCLINGASPGIVTSTGGYAGSWVNVTLPLWVTIMEDIGGSNLYSDLGYGTASWLTSAMKLALPTPDFKVDGRDITVAAGAFGTVPGDPRWSAIADVLHAYKVDGRDITVIAGYFGW
jgi:ABC-type transport system substrate-binding protein